MGELTLKNIRVHIEGKELLHDINCSLPDHQTLIIIGESGSGKTLLSKLLIGQIPPQASVTGQILLDGQDLLRLNDAAWSNYRGNVIAYVAQNPMALFNPMQTIASHGIELFRSRLSLSKEKSIERLIDALKKFNLPSPDTLIHKYPFQLSGGMLQRVMFAMMLELAPKLLIADEPTSALDHYNTHTVIESLRRCQQAGIRLIVITHDYELVKQLAHQILILKDGYPLEYGKAEDILRNPSTDYAKMLLHIHSYERYPKEGMTP